MYEQLIENKNDRRRLFLCCAGEKMSYWSCVGVRFSGAQATTTQFAAYSLQQLTMCATDEIALIISVGGVHVFYSLDLIAFYLRPSGINASLLMI